MTRFIARALCAATLCSAAHAAPIGILFVGNSYTFGRVDPVMSYDAAHVHDLTAAFYAADPTGANAFEPHPWGGVPGVFKKLTEEAGLDYDVSISTRNAASLRGHFLDVYNADWKLRENVATRRWDVVVLQEVSDGALPAGRSKHADLAQTIAYADRFERFIHDGSAQGFTEADLYGGAAACLATGASRSACEATRVVDANPNASAATKIYLTETWARPDMVFAHKDTMADRRSPDGRPVVDRRRASDGAEAALYYDSLAAMTADLHAGFMSVAAANPRFAGVLPIGDAFQYAIDHDLVKTDRFYDAGGVFVPQTATGRMDLWWDDRLHASKYGSYLDALVQFGVITGLDPSRFGAADQAAMDLGIDPRDALTLQHIATMVVKAGPT